MDGPIVVLTVKGPSSTQGTFLGQIGELRDFLSDLSVDDVFRIAIVQ